MCKYCEPITIVEDYTMTTLAAPIISRRAANNPDEVSETILLGLREDSASGKIVFSAMIDETEYGIFRFDVYPDVKYCPMCGKRLEK